jgi:hypothetical protein
MGYPYTLHLTVFQRGFYKTIDSPVPIVKGMSITVDLPGPTFECQVVDVELGVTQRPSESAAVDLVPKPENDSWPTDREEEVVACLIKYGWAE